MGYFFSKQSQNVNDIYPPSIKYNLLDYLYNKLCKQNNYYKPINDMASDITDYSDLMNETIYDEPEEIEYNLESFFD